MAGYVCTIAGGKGGVGKTTTAINIAAVLEKRGYKTVVIDADLGMANLGAMLEVDQGESIHEILSGNATVSEALADAPGGMTVIPGEQRLDAFAEADPANLRTVIDTLEEQFDVVLVDTGSGLSHEITVPLGLADGVVLVTTPDTVAINDTIKTADLAARVDGAVIGTLLTRVTRSTDVQDLATQFEMSLLGVIPLALETAGDEPLVQTVPDSDVAAAYRQLTSSLERVFFKGTSGSALNLVFDEKWVLDGAGESKDDQETDNETDDSEDDETEKIGIVSRLFGWL